MLFDVVAAVADAWCFQMYLYIERDYNALGDFQLTKRKIKIEGSEISVGASA